jgi:hypothetical protein
MLDDERHRAQQISHDQFALETQHPIPRPHEHPLAPGMVATIDFDHQRDSRRQKVDDVLPDDRLPTKSEPEPAARSACHSRASDTVGLSRIWRARTSSCRLR